MPDVKFSNQYPYTDFHELNLDWVISQVKYWSTKVGKTIQSIELTGTSGLVDTYTINYSDGTTSTFDVTNGNGITSVAKTGTAGLVDTYTITFQDGSTSAFTVTNGAAAVDPTLTLSDYAADAKITGDFLRSLSAIDVTWINGYFIGYSGNIISHPAYKVTDWIELSDGIRQELYYSVKVFENTAIYAIYDANKQFISDERTASPSLVVVSGTVVPADPAAKYIRFCSEESYDIVLRGGSAFKEKFIYSIPDNAITIPKVASDIIILDDNTNYIDYNTVLTGKYINASGNIQSSGSVNATDFIPLTGGQTYYYDKVYESYYAFYDSGKQLIQSYSTLGNLSGGSFTPPAGTAYGRFTIIDAWYEDEAAWINPNNRTPAVHKVTFNPDNIAIYADAFRSDNPCDYNGDEICTFTKCLCIGDSLTSGTFNYLQDGSTAHYVEFAEYSYPEYLERLTNLQVTNLGRGGETSAEWYAAEEHADLSGYDMAIIQLGVNDQIRYGEFGNTSKTAFTNIINKLKTENTKIKIFVANIIPAISYSDPAYLQFSADLLAWIQAQNALDPDIIPLDMQQYGHTRDLVAYNCGHLSAFGYYRLAKDYKAYISKYMINNPSLFREIQFIGTNYQYEA